MPPARVRERDGVARAILEEAGRELARLGRAMIGRFGPRPNVWTGFMAIYSLLALAGLGGIMLGWAQLSVKEYAWGFWLAPAALALIAFVYGAAVIGQGLTQDEMYVLRNFVDHMVAGDEREEPLCDDEAPPAAPE